MNDSFKIADSGSFVAAAKALHLTQAAVSRRMRALEEYLGRPLFVRNLGYWSVAFLPGFAASIDYYDIKVDGVISFVPAQTVADYCYVNNVQSYCSQLQFTGSTLSVIDLYYDNLNSLSAKGLDLEASYRTHIDAWIPGAAGDFSIRAQATHYIENITDDGVTAIDLAGLVNPADVGVLELGRRARMQPPTVDDGYSRFRHRRAPCCRT